MKEKKRIVILFNGPHLAYSPTVIGLYDLLSKNFDVTIIAETPQNFDGKPLINRKVIYLNKLKNRNQHRLHNKTYRILSIIYKDYAALKFNNCNLDVFYEYFQLKKHLKRINPDILISVDSKNLWFTELLGRKTEFLSLEIVENDKFHQISRKENINSVIIQSNERFQFLFGDKSVKTFFIQNAPIYQEFTDFPERKGLVYCGTAWNPFGFYHCLDFIRQHPNFSLTVKGAVLSDDMTKVENEYAEQLANKSIIIDNNYLDDKDVVAYLRQFRIGFCFYNFEIDWINTFNYLSAPSGKMFKYFAAGVPVIGVDVSGLAPIKKFDCGILIKDLSPESIKIAIDKIEANFDYYSANCLNAAKYYSFNKSSQPFIEYLNG